MSSNSPIIEAECAVCLDAKPNVLLTCRHACICTVCLRELLQDGVLKCPLCRHERNQAVLLDMKSSLTDVARDMDHRELDDTLYRLLLALLEIASTTTFNPTQVWDTIQAYYKTTPGVISVDQAESLLTMAEKKNLPLHKEYYGIQALIVILTSFPWSVDVRLASSGVCYYGNMGNVPSLIMMANLYTANHDKILGRPFKSVL